MSLNFSKEDANIKLELLIKLSQKDISYHHKFGADNDLSEVEDSKNLICNKVSILLKDCIGEYNNFDQLALKTGYNILSKLTNDLYVLIEENIPIIEKFTAPNQAYTGIRNTFTSQVIAIEARLTGLNQLSNEVRFSKLSTLQSNSAQVKNFCDIAKENFGSLKKLLDESQTILEKLNVAQAQSDFDGRVTEHKKYQRWWGIGFIVFIIAIIITVTGFPYIASKLDISELISNNKYSEIFLKFFFISLFFSMGRISLNKYNLERNLYIVYKHRLSAIEYFKTESEKLNPDHRTVEDLRITLASYIFSDPLTGYGNESKNKELNISPVVNVIDKAMRAASSNKPN